MNKSYAIGYRFEQRVKKYMKNKGWNVLRQAKSAFPDLLCWRHKGYILEGNIKNDKYIYEIVFIECKCNKYLNKEEKEKAIKIIKNEQCSHFYVAHRKKYSRKIYFYKLFKDKTTKEVDL